jgi:molybdate transport system substrate-binding protein
MKTMPLACRSARLTLGCILFAAVAAYGAEIRVMTSGAFTAAYLELKSQYEQATQDKIVTLATTMGTGPDFIPNRLQRRELVDVLIVDDAALDRLIADGRVVATSKVPLGRSNIGMAVRAGARKPDISSIDALKRTLLEAKSVAYSASVSGDYLSTELFQRLGIADRIALKSKRIEHERVGAVVARGEAEIGFQQVSELLPIKGIDYVGPLPGEVQRVTVFSAGVAMGSKNSDAASRFIRFLASPDAASTVARSGLEPIATIPATPTAFHPMGATIDDIHGALRSGRTMCRKLVELYLERVAAYNKSGPSLNAIQVINPHALQEAERVDAAAVSPDVGKSIA